MKVLILGATGIIGQHLRFHQPPEAHRDGVVYVARHPAGLPWVQQLDLEAARDDVLETERLLAGLVHDRGMGVRAIINLAGEASVDAVERDPERYRWINETFPGILARYCHGEGIRLVHVSSQAALGGNRPPYFPLLQSLTDPGDLPVNEYGWQKRRAEWAVLQDQSPYCWVARLTFILGVRPFPHVGRPNPLEQALKQSGDRPQLVADRWFSPCFASEAAIALWRLVIDPPERKLVNVGSPARLSRADVGRLAWMAKKNVETHPGLDAFSDTGGTGLVVDEVKHDDAYPTLAQRPKDTTFAFFPGHEPFMQLDLAGELMGAANRWRHLLDLQDTMDRSAELAAFFGLAHGEAHAHLGRGFGQLHGEVAADFHRFNPKNDSELLQWYRRTQAYIWELTAYHLDKGYNYAGMCEGFATHLKREAGLDPTTGATSRSSFRVLCLGDGVGDLSIVLHDAGLRVHYHDLEGSETARFAQMRFSRRYGERGRGPGPVMTMSAGWLPPQMNYADWRFDAIVALDFFEHMPNVEQWAFWLPAALAPGGWFFAQNAFGIGDPEHGGSIPQHLSRNNKYADPDESGRAGWDSLLFAVELERADGGWWRKPR